MSCPNFNFMYYDMPMVCGGLEDYCELKEIYEAGGDEFNELDYEFYIQDEIDYAEKLAKEFTKNLYFHDVTIKPGYYYGFQFWVEEKYSRYFDLDKLSRDCITNDDAHYYFDMYRSEALRGAEAEKKKIEKFLYDLKNKGFEVLGCTGVFSNGEAVYLRL